VTLTNGRFDGTASEAEGYNGISGKVNIRQEGTFSVKASWGDTPSNYTYTLVDLTVPAPGGTHTGNATGLERTDPAVPTHQYAFSLTNDETTSGRVPLTMTVGW
jgi:hypothetical protein